MLLLAQNGATVLHDKSIIIGKKYNVPIYVKSTFIKNSTGTFIGN